jgi:hypothetical protein
MNMTVHHTRIRFCSFLVGIASLTFLAPWGRAGSPAPAKPKRPLEKEVARQVDQALLRALGKSFDRVGKAAADETFLRRLSLDLTGKVPSPAAVRAFVAAADPAKRSHQIDRFLATKEYAVNWARYWRDVITYHTPASGNYLRWPLFDQWLVEQVQTNRSWGSIVTALVTATGINDECAPVNYLTAQFGNPVEIAATTSRVFLGVQLQCAQCHDSKTDKWKRNQFHEFVAFFGRAKLIQHKDVDGRGTPYAIEGRADGQYRMPDKKNPKRLIVMRPRFLTGEAVALKADDRQRRAALARFLTSPKNPWFARAYVNRIWTSLMGWGFYPGVSDLGSAAEPIYPEVLNLLAREWTATGYDVKWLFRTLTLTQAYQRRLQPRARQQSMPVAVCPSRLRPEQIFEAMVAALGFNEFDKRIPAPAPSSAPAVARHSGLRHMVYQAFKIDPSLPLDETQGTIPQALLMMNSVLVNTYIAATGNTFLAQALIRGQSDDQILNALYERTLSRKPKARELAICKRYLKKVGKRQEALEDIFWSLINSTEFLTKH